MLHIGCHLSTTKGYASMGIEALSINANTFQFFTRNPRGSKAKAINKNDVAKLCTIMEENTFAPILAHAPYTLNPCSKDSRTREFAWEIVEDDLRRLDQLPCSLYNIHPGSHTGLGTKQGIRLIAEMLNAVITPDQKTTILLETMAGKGSEIGSKFEELKEIIDLVNQKDKIGICMDTCHVSDSGYDIINGLDGVLDEFDKVIGLEKLRAVHLNDSLYPTSSHKDRHAKIGEGMIGFEALVNVISHPSLAHLPFFLETPNDLPGYAKEIEMLRKAYKD